MENSNIGDQLSKELPGLKHEIESFYKDLLRFDQLNKKYPNVVKPPIKEDIYVSLPSENFGAQSWVSALPKNKNLVVKEVQDISSITKEDLDRDIIIYSRSFVLVCRLKNQILTISHFASTTMNWLHDQVNGLLHADF
jgi:hypothetical protein